MRKEAAELFSSAASLFLRNALTPPMLFPSLLLAELVPALLLGLPLLSRQGLPVCPALLPLELEGLLGLGADACRLCLAAGQALGPFEIGRAHV